MLSSRRSQSFRLGRCESGEVQTYFDKEDLKPKKNLSLTNSTPTSGLERAGGGRGGSEETRHLLENQVIIDQPFMLSQRRAFKNV